MSLPVPLGVQIGDLYVEHEADDLTYDSEVNGGFKSASLSLARPLRLDDPNLQRFQPFAVTCGRTGRIMWNGRLEDPARTAGPDGEVWKLTAIGPKAYAYDNPAPYGVVDRNLENWYVDQLSSGRVRAGRTTRTEYSADPTLQGMELQFPGGAVLPTNGVHRMRYSLMREANQYLARFDYRHIEGRNSPAGPTLVVQAAVRDLGGGYAIVRGDAGDVEGFSTTEAGSNARVMITHYADDVDIIEVQIKWTGAAGQQIGDDNTWSSFGGLYVMTQRFDLAGNVVASYPTHTVLAHQIIADVLVRFLPDIYDAATASLTSGTIPIDQWAFWEGTTAGAQFDKLCELERTFWWGAWERLDSGKYFFQCIAWPSDARYEADADLIDTPGSPIELYNWVRVLSRNERGSIKWSNGSQAIRELDDAGIRRGTIVNLSDTIGSSANAAATLAATLADHSMAPLGGTMVIDRPIADFYLGREVHPYEIRPGYLIRLRGMRPRVSSLTATDRDGVSVARVVGTSYNANSNSCTLQLDVPTMTTARQIAKLRRAVFG